MGIEKKIVRSLLCWTDCTDLWFPIEEITTLAVQNSARPKGSRSSLYRPAIRLDTSGNQSWVKKTLS